MKTIRALLMGCILALQCTASWAVYAVRISDLDNSNMPLPPNPIKVWGQVTSQSPLTLSDGTAEITVIGVTAWVGDFLVVTGDWDGSELIVDGAVDNYVGPAPPSMIDIPAGSFLMGNNGSEPHSWPDELPQHSVNLSEYYIGEYDVTRGEYQLFMNAGGYSNSAYWSVAGWKWITSNNRTQPDFWAANQNWGTGAFTQTDNQPVVGVTYYEAQAFCTWAGGHLPTEAQWEKAARWNATTNHPNVYPWGDTWNQQNCKNLNDSLYPGYQTAPVGSYPSGASPYGCQDMAGNVWEWCSDWYSGTYYTPSPFWNNPTGPTSGSNRVVRGGAWNSYYNDDATRCAYRDSAPPNSTGWGNIGFRLAR